MMLRAQKHNFLLCDSQVICDFRLCMVNYIILYKKFVEHHVIKLILLKISKLSARLTQAIIRDDDGLDLQTGTQKPAVTSALLCTSCSWN